MVASHGDGLVLMVNAQWQLGQVVSDFGFGPWKRSAEEFVASFQDTYVLKTYRINGDTVRWLLTLASSHTHSHGNMVSTDVTCNQLNSVPTKQL